MNPIEYLQSQGFKITSDPNGFHPWGYRRYMKNGYHYDQYCNGYHRAYDLSKYHHAKVPSVINGIVVSGTSSKGNFGGTVVVANRDLDVQVIYGHLKTPINVRIGQTLKIGDTVGYQSSTNYYNVPMNSHLHIQFQPFGYIPNEKTFVCTGINAKMIDIHQQFYRMKGSFVFNYNVYIRERPSIFSKHLGMKRKNDKVWFNGVIRSQGYYWIKVGNACIAVGKDNGEVAFKDIPKWGTLLI